MKNIKKYRINIEVEYASEYQEVLGTGELVRFLQTWEGYVISDHKKNKVNMEILEK